MAAAERSPITRLLDDVTFNNVKTTDNSISVPCADYRKFTVFVEVKSNNTPTSIQFRPQFSIDGGISWFDLYEEQYPSLMQEDTGTVTATARCYTGDCASPHFSLYTVAVGTTAPNTFIVSAWVHFWG
jgi:hypothetical protein